MTNSAFFDKVLTKYLFGDRGVPNDFADETLMREDFIRSKIDVLVSDYMNGAGRFAKAPLSSMVEAFFTSPVSLPAGTYSKKALESFYGLTAYGIKFQQYQYADDIDDYFERTFIWNTVAFQIADGAEFVVSVNGEKVIKNFAVLPRESENFDFVSNNFWANMAEGYAQDRIDLSRIGRVVDIKFVGISETKDYNLNNFLADKAYLQESNSWFNIPKLYSDSQAAFQELFSDGITRYVDSASRPIIYGSILHDTLVASEAENNPFFTSLLPNGVRIIAGSGEDILEGGGYNDFLEGNDGDDALFGNDGQDTLEGGDGNDTLDGQKGDAIYIGGEGADLFVIDRGADYIVINDADALDRIVIRGDGLNIGSHFDYTYDESLSNLGFELRTGHQLWPSEYQPYDKPDSQIWGLGGYHETYEVDGHRFRVRASATLEESTLQIKLYDIGLAGHTVTIDVLIFSNGNLGLSTQANPDVEWLRPITKIDLSEASRALGVTLTGTDNTDTLLGTNNADVLDGRGGTDTLDGEGGDDVLIGGAGADVIDGGTGIDTASYRTATTSVYVHMLDLAQNTGDAAGDSYTSVENITGSEFNDVLIATDENNLVHGLGGDDVIVGLAGANTLSGDDGDDAVHGGDDVDIIMGGAGNDSLFGYGGSDNLQGGDGNDYFVGGDGNDTLIGDNGNDEIHASAGDDFLTGGSGDDGLFGDEGRDRIDGGSGNDFLLGGSGNDTFVFASNFGHDFLADFTFGTGSGDVVEIANLGVSNFSGLQSLMAEYGGNTFITFADGSELTMQNVTISQLVADDFRFV